VQNATIHQQGRDIPFVLPFSPPVALPLFFASLEPHSFLPVMPPGRTQGSGGPLKNVEGGAVYARRLVDHSMGVVSLTAKLGMGGTVFVRAGGPQQRYTQGLYSGDLAMAKTAYASAGAPFGAERRKAVERVRTELSSAREKVVAAKGELDAVNAPGSLRTLQEKLDSTLEYISCCESVREVESKLADTVRVEAGKEAEEEVVDGVLRAILGQVQSPNLRLLLKKHNADRASAVPVQVPVGLHDDSFLALLPPFLADPSRTELRKGWNLDLCLTPGVAKKSGATINRKLAFLVS